MQTKTVKISEIKPNPNNPRLIKDEKFVKLVNSIKGFPEMLKIRPIVVNSDMIVLGGNMRLKACKEAGLKEIPIIFADDLTEEQQQEFIIKDNVGFGEWDWDMIANEWEPEQLEDWGLDVPGFALGDSISNTNDYTDLDVESKLDKFLDAKIKSLNIPFESSEFDDVVLRLENYLEKFGLNNYKEMVYKMLENESL
jgi:ParB-like chromosome segregation protein Spo0J